MINLTKVTIYLLTSCNTEERIAQNIYIHNSNRNYKKKINYNNNNINQEQIGIGYKNYRKQCPGLEFRLIPKLILNNVFNKLEMLKLVSTLERNQ